MILSEVELFDVSCQGVKAPFPMASCLIGFFDKDGNMKDEHDCVFEAELSADKQSIIVRLEERRHHTFYEEFNVSTMDSTFLKKFEEPLTEEMCNDLLDVYRHAIEHVFNRNDVNKLLRRCG